MSHVMRHGAMALIASVVVLGSTAAALARPAVTTHLANMRSGPGVGYPIIAAIPEYSPVDMGECARTWCRVTWNGVAGYVASGLLSRRTSAVTTAPSPPVPHDDTYRYIYGGYGPYFCDPYFDPYCYNYIYFDTGGWYRYDRRHRRWRPHPGPHQRPGPVHGQPRPRPGVGAIYGSPRVIPGPAPGPGRNALPPPGVGRGAPGGAGAAAPGIPGGGGGVMSAPRGGPVGGPGPGAFGGSRGGFASPGGGPSGGRGAGGGGHGHGR